ncbi:MAG: DUF1566 domain-containing protein [Nitrospirae bacterium]|nr:DUF1566 domain-containing protein [Nitrospirota bacterium]
MKPKVYLLAVILCCILTFAVWAGTVNLPQTGQTTCWDAYGDVISCAGTGQDGAIKAGVAWPNPRFTDNGDQTMTDNLTGLIWAKDASTPSVGLCKGGAMSWQDALGYVACLNIAIYLGYNDWRLPNINEMKSLENIGQGGDSGTWLDTQGFTTVESSYWSSTTCSGIPSLAWVVGLTAGASGAVGGAKTNGNSVWPVRAGQSGSFNNAAIWQTGQTNCWDSNGNPITCTGTGQDGDIRAGTVWPNPRFTDNGDGTVTDNLTGLTWTKDAGTPTAGSCTGGYMPWQNAPNYVSCLNKASYLGHTDWRLPNITELRSLADYSQSNPALPAGNPFTTAQTFYYWSSSTYASIPSEAWLAGMDGGYELADLKTSFIYSTGYVSLPVYVWPLRGGLPPTPTPVGCPQATLSSAFALYIPNLQYTPAFGSSMNLWFNLVSQQIGGNLYFEVSNYGVNQGNSTPAGCPQATLSPALTLYIPNLQYTPASGSSMNLWLNLAFQQTGNYFYFEVVGYGLNP